MIIKRSKYVLKSGPQHLQERFPDWCFKGIKFDTDVRPIDTQALHQHLDAVREEIEMAARWQRLCYHFQGVNKANIEAMVTMDSDKAEWDKFLKASEEEKKQATSRISELEREVSRLRDELASSTTFRETREQLLNDQLREAHTAQKNAEDSLEAERTQVESYRTEVSKLREASSSQNEEIHNLKMQLAQSNRQWDEAVLLNTQLQKERDDALAAKIEAEKALADNRARMDETLDAFYVRCVLGKGSLDFLGDQFPITLAVTWERILAEFEGQNYTEEDLIDYYLNDASRTALAKGKEELAEQRAQVEEAIQLSLEPATEPQPEAAPEKKAQTSSEKESSMDVQGFEIQTRIPPPQGNTFNEAFPVDGSKAPFGIDELYANYDCVHSPYVPQYVPQYPEFMDTTDISLSPLFQTDTGVEQPPPSSGTLPQTLLTTPSEQPGSQEEMITAIKDIDVVTPSQEQDIEERIDESVEGLKTPEKQIVGAKEGDGGSGSSTKKGSKGKKRTVSKKKTQLIDSGKEEDKEEGELETGATATTPPKPRRKKLLIKIGDETKGGQKK